MCSTQLTTLLKNVRRFRLLDELLTDVAHILINGIDKKNKKRLSGYNLFCREIRVKMPEIKGKVSNHNSFFLMRLSLMEYLLEFLFRIRKTL